ncbi:MAG: hypothetical protein COU07_03500 [Candidatus Harrisonbacteria bacterium CG10_big_fil_rev_8_21_14_0_10_40_38]|uniref:Uncharacterized protein n=1 Tax=Candidatus Harrisonbacteria bacterium CG10_big_fil_rev_8_21_14_0_10_40_38 TaxID=1974583 RepID=A0A2H0UTG3_9BACT|nr:MAG: hypothetical protein COU07_03500 [Candidatus Harrisonbacteria bacterium CG10_big_fil_rev_8_21_14_0_10_40_38]
MTSSIHDFLDRIRKSPIKTRKRWQYTLTASAMVIIIAGWGAYTGLLIKPAFSETKQESAQSEPGITGTFSAGLAVIVSEAQDLGSKLSDYLRSTIGSSRKIKVERSQ